MFDYDVTLNFTNIDSEVWHTVLAKWSNLVLLMVQLTCGMVTQPSQYYFQNQVV